VAREDGFRRRGRDESRPYNRIDLGDVAASTAAVGARFIAPSSPQPGPAAPTAFLLAIRHLSASYHEGRRTLPVLDDVSFSVGAGEFVALIGPSGSGKSTLLDLVAGLAEPDRGEIRLDGNPTPAPDRLGRAAYMRQRDLLLPWRTALDNAALGLEAGGVARRAARAAARARFPEFGLVGFEGAYPGQLSGGMRQRVAFLRTALLRRPLLLLDEPFGALDALTRAAMQDWLLDRLESAADGRPGVLLVTHDVEEAVLLADRVIVLTPAPGRVAHVERIALPRPRQRTLVTDPAFVRHKGALLAALGLLPGGDR